MCNFKRKTFFKQSSITTKCYMIETIEKGSNNSSNNKAIYNSHNFSDLAIDFVKISVIFGLFICLLSLTLFLLFCYIYLDCNYFITPITTKRLTTTTKKPFSLFSMCEKKIMCTIINNATFPHYIFPFMWIFLFELNANSLERLIFRSSCWWKID